MQTVSLLRAWLCYSIEALLTRYQLAVTGMDTLPSWWREFRLRLARTAPRRRPSLLQPATRRLPLAWNWRTVRPSLMDWASYSKLRDRTPYVPPLAARLLPDTLADERDEVAYEAACSPPWDGLTRNEQTAWGCYARDPDGELTAVYVLPAAVKRQSAPPFEVDRLFARFAA
jgi:hypothetical protein